MSKGGDITRKKLLTAALKLFTHRPYAKVTLREIEEVTGLSRGAIMYHVPDKETLFREAVEMFVFRNNTLTDIPDLDSLSLEQTIKAFVKVLADQQEHWRREGIRNINFALFTVQMSYYSLIEEARAAAGDWYENECSLWSEAIRRAIASGEIREVDADLFAHIFEDCYLGTAYAGLARPDGYDPATVGTQLLAVYATLKP